MYQNKYLILLEDCRVVRGAKRSCIYDLHNNDYHFIPNTLAEILLKYNRESISFIFSEFPDNIQDITNYIEYLIDKGLIFLGDSVDAKSFGYLDLSDLKLPFPAYSSTIEINTKNIQETIQIIKSIDKVNIPNIQIHSKSVVSEQSIITVIDELSTSSFNIIEFLVPYADYTTQIWTNDLKKKNNRIRAVIIHNAPFDYVDDSEYNMVYFTTNTCDNSNSLEKIKEFFTINHTFFIESSRYNPFFRRSVAIDIFGNIKNAFQSETIFGNIKNDSLYDILLSEKFNFISNISKSKIKICQDCEFRNMCYDSRIPILNGQNEWEYETTCLYNPYNTIWNE